MVNLLLIAPELGIGVLALVVLLLDLFLERKTPLAAVSVVGLAAPLGFTFALWGKEETAFFGMLVVDRFSLFFSFLFIGIAALIILSSQDYVPKFPRFQGEYYALILLTTMGFMLLAATRELISIYIALELSSIPLAALACLLKDPKSTEAGIKYLLLSAIASAVVLYGMALVFGFTGTTHLEGIARSLGETGFNEPALIFAVVLLVLGFGFKIAAVPIHMWLPDVYEGAPTPITAYLSVASKAAGFAVILRFFATAFTIPGWFVGDWGMIFAVLSAITMTLGNVLAILQENIKRLLGYSSIAHSGYIMVGLAALGMGQSPELFSRSAVLFFLASYTLANLGAFIAVIAITNKTGSDLVQDFSGMARRAPMLSLILTICLVSLIGIPPTAGFIAKVYIFNAGVQAGLVWLVIIAVVNTAISVYYYLRIVKEMYLGEALSSEEVPSSLPLRATLAVSLLGVLLLGIYPYAILRFTEAATMLT